MAEEQFGLTREQETTRSEVQRFADRYVRPIAAEIDRESRWPAENLPRMAELGLLGVNVPPEHGGLGRGMVSYAVAIEELSRACASHGVIASVNNSLACWPLLQYGTNAQKLEYLTPLARGEKLGAFALTEPGHPSSRTTAAREGGTYILSGCKRFVMNGGHADVCLVFADIEGAPRQQSTTAFLVDADSPGFGWGSPEPKMSVRAAHTTELRLDGVEIPSGNLLGEPGGGHALAMETLEGGRIGIAAQAVGIAQACIDDAMAYIQDREREGKELSHVQAIQFKITDMHMRTKAARLLTYHAAALKDAGEEYGTAASEAKCYAGDTAMWAALECVQIHGGRGILTEYPAERHMRDAKVTQIYEGTNEIQRVIVARALFEGGVPERPVRPEAPPPIP